jgi:alpha-guaiene 2-oxidase
MKDIVFAPYGKYWREIRKMCVMELFSTKQIISFKYIREEEIQNLIQWISSSSCGGEIVELTKGLLVLTNNVAFRAIVGSNCNDRVLVLTEIMKAFEYDTVFSLPNLFPSSRKWNSAQDQGAASVH